MGQTSSSPSTTPCPTFPPTTRCPTFPPTTSCPTFPPTTRCPTFPPTTSCPSCPTCPVQTPCPSCPTCPVQTPCPSCPTCPVQTPCPKLKLFYVDNTTSGQIYKVYWNNTDPNYSMYSYVLSLSTDKNFNNNNTYSFPILSLTQTSITNIISTNSDIFVSTINTNSDNPVSYAKISMLNQGSIIEESNIINITKLALETFILTKNSRGGDIAYINLTLSSSFLQKINNEWESPGPTFYPFKFIMTCIATDGTRNDYSFEIPINLGVIKAGRNILSAIDIQNLPCIPSYIRLFTILPNQEPYYSNYLQPTLIK